MVKKASSTTGVNAGILYFALYQIVLIFLMVAPNMAQTWNGSSSRYLDSIIALKNSISEYPEWDVALHDAGNMQLSVSNYNALGYGYFIVEEEKQVRCIFPANSDLEYLSGFELWIGGVIGRDTLVSTGMSGSHTSQSEFHPDISPMAAIERRSIQRSSPYRHHDAVSEQDFICAYTDTQTNPEFVGEDPYDNRPHKPLYVSVDQASYVWSFDYARDFVLFDFAIANIGKSEIRDMFVGIQVRGHPYHKSETHYYVEGHTILGFRGKVDSHPGSCPGDTNLNIAWFANDDGHPNLYREWDHKSPRSVIGLQVLRPKFNKSKFNFNWWTYQSYDPAYNWGPRMAGTDDDPFRAIGEGLGVPRGDRNRYYLMSHREFDYDLMFTAINHGNEGFLPPPPHYVAENLADGFVMPYLLSFGPFDLAPGDSIPLTFALVAGENFHIHPYDFENYFDPHHPEIYYSKLDFSDLAQNSRWARAIFDNPGVDTDGDGYRGEFCWKYTWRDTTEADPSDSFVVDSIRHYYTGDTIPDFKAMTPSPPPVVRVTPSHGRVVLRWNGQESENTPDYFSGQVDFEGYRVYYGEDDRLSDFVLLSSYDIDDYVVYHFDTDNRNWNKISNSAKHDSLKQLYGPDFDANDFYDQFNYFLDPNTGEVYYFVRQDWNRSDLSNPLGIHKVYPDASPYDSADVTLEGWRRYYEYEYVIENLEPSKPYYFAVTAFDYGSFQYDIGQLETSPTTNAVREYALTSADTVEHKGLGVIVYPNPYRIDGGYARAGYENRDRTKSAVWSRRIHFANLPNICTIRIFSIDGDLIQKIDHYNPTGGPESQHEEWNVVSRNTQAVVTGIYLWHVKSEMGEQLGKLVIIK
jgi:hypothetical protein